MAVRSISSAAKKTDTYLQQFKLTRQDLVNFWLKHVPLGRAFCRDEVSSLVASDERFICRTVVETQQLLFSEPGDIAAGVVPRKALESEVDGIFGPMSLRRLRAYEEFSRPTPPMVLGVDVSAWQPNIDWKRARVAGIRYVFVKATQDESYDSKTFAKQVEGALAAELDVSAYHFAIPETGDSPESEADHFLAAVAKHKFTLRPALDFEERHQGKRIKGADGKMHPDPAFAVKAIDLARWAERFVARVAEATGEYPIFYAYTGMLRFIAPHVGSDSPLLKCPLWQSQVGKGGGPLAKPAPTVKPFQPATIHQFSWTGQIDGIPGRVDMNRCPAGSAIFRGEA